MGKNKVSRLIQVCAQVMDKNFDWKYNGLVEVIEALGLTGRDDSNYGAERLRRT